MRINVFTDRDGDTLSVCPRRAETPGPDPIITITHTTAGHDISQSVVFNDKGAVRIIIGIIGALNLNKEQINEIYDWLTAVHTAVNREGF